MGLPWSRMDNNWPWNPKFLELVAAKRYDAVCLFWASVAYASGQETGGHIPSKALGVLHGTKRMADSLLFVSLWLPGLDGWDIKNFDEYQATGLPPPDVRRERARNAANRRWHPDASEHP